MALVVNQIISTNTGTLTVDEMLISRTIRLALTGGGVEEGV